MSDMTTFQIIISIITGINSFVLAWLVFDSIMEKAARETGEDIGRIKEHCELAKQNLVEIKTDIRTVSASIETVRKESATAHDKIVSNIESLRLEVKQDIGKTEDKLSSSIDEMKNLMLKFMDSNNNNKA